ncbi:CvpA family protein [Flavobacterium silvaticum]|uniref:CvpA family protein n=1 Tax=Flavobacterium silvaticum TaxID=1852020 RepID=A0A972FNQ5_9FLAO|nr:CvpA family protein [Flavobacterium silvaticum]NMH26614.1 CvpA family protein [Flavobacterium silvaticum]
MLILDLLLAGALLYGTVKGLWNGFFAELAALISFFLGIYVALAISGSLKEFLEAHTKWQPISIRMIAFGIPFLFTIIGISLLARWLNKVVSLGGLSPFNKVAGGFIGFFKTLLIISIFLNLFFNLNSGGFFATKEELDQSYFFNPIRQFGTTIYPMLEQWYLEM